jgi:eukaryotic-like serine/threonine-protein kinase
MTEDLKRGSKLGNYELLVRIGRGGMATVWVALERGETREADRLVAIKAILTDLAGDPEFVKMFLDEGRIIRMIRHPNVVDVHDVAEQEGLVYLAMEWVEGDSLHAVIAEAGKRRPIPPEMAVRIIADAASGLHAAHELKDADGALMGVVHRDVSPHNILIGRDGAIKLVDFGVAKAMGRVSEATSAGQLKGKFGYMSPEQAMAKKVDRRSDIFALGIVLFELTTGRRLFRGEHDAETLHLVVSGKIPKPTALEPTYPAALEEVVLKALARDPSKRYQTAQEFHQALEGYLKAERTVVPRAGVANLLKKVMGTRLEQRRKAIRSALRAIEGEPVDAINLAPGDASQPGGEHISVVSVVTDSGRASGPSSITPAPNSVSGITDPSQPSVTGSYASPTLATSPQTVPAVMVKRSGAVGYVIGIVGLAAALLVVLFFVFNPRRTKTTIVSVPASPGAEQSGHAADLSPVPQHADDPNVPTVALDDLGSVLDGGARRAPIAARGTFPKAPAAPATTAKKKEPEAPPAQTAPPRKNPYE